MDILRCWLSSRKVQRVGRNTNKVSKRRPTTEWKTVCKVILILLLARTNWFVYLRYELTVYIEYYSANEQFCTSRDPLITYFTNMIIHTLTHTHIIILYILYILPTILISYVLSDIFYFEKPRCTSCCICTDQQVPQLSGVRCDGSSHFPFSENFGFPCTPLPRCISQIWDICNWQYLIFSTYILLHHVNARRTLPPSRTLNSSNTRICEFFFI
jgi:hypothetical protein